MRARDSDGVIMPCAPCAKARRLEHHRTIVQRPLQERPLPLPDDIGAGVVQAIRIWRAAIVQGHAWLDQQLTSPGRNRTAQQLRAWETQLIVAEQTVIRSGPRAVLY